MIGWLPVYLKSKHTRTDFIQVLRLPIATHKHEAVGFEIRMKGHTINNLVNV